MSKEYITISFGVGVISTCFLKSSGSPGIFGHVPEGSTSTWSSSRKTVFITCFGGVLAVAGSSMSRWHRKRSLQLICFSIRSKYLSGRGLDDPRESLRGLLSLSGLVSQTSPQHFWIRCSFSANRIKFGLLFNASNGLAAMNMFLI